MKGTTRKLPPPELPLGFGSNTFLDAPIVHSLYQLYAQFHIVLLKFPRVERYSLGMDIQKSLLQTTKSVIAAAANANLSEKSQHLKIASVNLDTTKLLIRLAKDTKSISNKQYLDFEGQLHEIGKMLGGWIKMLQSK